MREWLDKLDLVSSPHFLQGVIRFQDFSGKEWRMSELLEAYAAHQSTELEQLKADLEQTKKIVGEELWELSDNEYFMKTGSFRHRTSNHIASETGTDAKCFHCGSKITWQGRYAGWDSVAQGYWFSETTGSACPKSNFGHERKLP